MAAAHDPGGLRPHPPGRRPGPRPSSEMARKDRARITRGGHLPAGHTTGAAEPPPRSRAPPASLRDDAARHPVTRRGTRGAREAPDEEMPAAQAGDVLAGTAGNRRGDQAA